MINYNKKEIIEQAFFLQWNWDWDINDLIEQLQEAVDKGFNKATTENPQDYNRFRFGIAFKQSREETDEEYSKRIEYEEKRDAEWEKRREEQDYQFYLQLKERFENNI